MAMHRCNVCSCNYTDEESGVEGYFGMLPVAFCPTCFSSMCDMVQQFMVDEWPEENQEIDLDGGLSAVNEQDKI
jgi:hypothetical protein